MKVEMDEFIHNVEIGGHLECQTNESNKKVNLSLNFDLYVDFSLYSIIYLKDSYFFSCLRKRI